MLYRKTYTWCQRDDYEYGSQVKQLVLDIEGNGLSHVVRLPKVQGSGGLDNSSSLLVPLLARTRVSRHSRKLTPLPGRLPLSPDQLSMTANTANVAIGPFPVASDSEPSFSTLVLIHAGHRWWPCNPPNFSRPLRCCDSLRLSFVGLSVN